MTEHQRDEQRDAVMADPIGDAWRAQMAHDRERYKSACARVDALREELRQLRHEVRLLKDRNAILEARERVARGRPRAHPVSETSEKDRGDCQVR